MLARVTDIFTVSDFSLRFVRVHLAYLFFGLLMMAYCMCMLVGRVTQDGVIEVVSISSPCCAYTQLDPILGISYDVQDFEGMGYVVLSPDEQQYAFVGRDSENQYSTLYLTELWNTEPPFEPVVTADHITSIVWSADGQYLAFVATFSGLQNIYVFDLSMHTLSQAVFDLENCAVPAWSPDGHYLTGICDNEHEEGRGIYVINRMLNVNQRISDEVGHVQSLLWSPDSTEIVFQSLQTESANQYIAPSYLYSMNPDGSNLHQLTPGDYSVASFAWSPDSTHLLFLASLGFSPQKSLFLMSRDGSNIEPLALPVDRYVARIAWYADFGMQSP